MHRAPAIVAAVICVALLSVQLSGLHMHINLQGDDGEPHTTHVHESDPDGDDHSDDIEVSVFELGSAWAKVMVFIMPVAVVLLGITWLVQAPWPFLVQRLTLKRSARWRPPLRAPPASI